MARAVAVDRLDLGFVDILSTEGALDHPLCGPQEELYWRRELLASTEAPRSRQPVVDSGVVASVGATFAIKPRRIEPDPEAVAAILEQIGLGPNGRPVGLPGLRVRHLPAVRRGGGDGPGVACGNARPTRSAGRTRRSGRRRWTR